MSGFRGAIEKELRGVNASGASRNITSGLSGAFATVAKIGAGAMATVAAAAAGIGAAVAGVALKGGISRALNIEQATAKLAGLGHSTESVAALMDNATTAVKGTAYGLDAAATVAAQFAAVGISAGQDMTDVLTTVADTAQISGRSFEDIGTIFSSVAAKGKLDGQDMLQLTSAGVPVLQFLSKQLGVTTADVSDMVSSGKIDFETFADAMQAGLGGAAQAAGTTFSGALSNVQAALSRLGASVATPALEALRILFIGLIPVIDGVTAGLKPAMDALGPQLASAAEAAVGSFGQLGEVLGQSLAAAMPAVSQALVSLIGLLPQIIGAVGQLMPVLIQAAADILPTLVQATIALMPVIVQIIGLAAQILPTLVQIAADALPGIVAAITTLTPVIITVVSAVAGFVAQHQGLLSVLAGVAGAVGVAVAAYRGFQIIQTVVSFMRTLGAALTVVRAGMSLSAASTLLATGGYTANAAAMGVATGASSAFAVAQKLVNAAMNANPIVKIVGLLILLGTALVVAYQKSETFRNIVNGAWQGIKDAAGAVVGWFQDTLVPIFQTAWDGIQVGLDFLKNVFTTAWEGIKVAVAIALTPMQLLWEGMVAAWQNLIAPALTWLWQTIFQPAWQGIQAVVQAVAGWFTGTLVPLLQGA
ncbi:tape measure protein, partial [Propionibacterium australiense]